MGGSMCCNIAAKHSGRVLPFDLSPQARAAMEATDAELAEDVGAI